MKYQDTQGSMEIPKAGWCLMQFLGNRGEMTRGHPWNTSRLQVSEESLCCTSVIAPISAQALLGDARGVAARSVHQGHQQMGVSPAGGQGKLLLCSRIKQLGAKSKYPPERLFFHSDWTTRPHGGVQQIPQFPAETRRCLISIQHGHQTKAWG